MGFKAGIETGGFQGWNLNWLVPRLVLKLVGFKACIETGGFKPDKLNLDSNMINENLYDCIRLTGLVC